MARPRKWRRVCCIPENNFFGPLGVPLNEDEIITMTIDEYETIRLIDHEGLVQEECAKSMGVARTTVQRIYGEARQKIADSLINDKGLKIEGGEYKLFNDEERRYGYGCGRCRNGRHAGGHASGPRKGLGRNQSAKLLKNEN